MSRATDFPNSCAVISEIRRLANHSRHLAHGLDRFIRQPAFPSGESADRLSVPRRFLMSTRRWAAAVIRHGPCGSLPLHVDHSEVEDPWYVVGLVRSSPH